MSGPEKPPVEVDQLRVSGQPGMAAVKAMTLDLLNIIGEAMRPLRQPETAPDMESMIMAAAVTYAGVLHGELMGIGVVPDLTDEALRVMLMTNFRTGQRVGLGRVDGARMELAAEEKAATGQGKPS